MFTRAFLIRSVDFGDADRIVTLLTKDRGKVSALARGARRSKRRFAGALEASCLLEVEISAGRGDLALLNEARIVRSYSGVLADLRKLSLVGATCELLRVVCPEDEPDERIFQTTERWMHATDRAEVGVSELAAAYQLRVLALAGFGPQVESCARSGRPAPVGRAAMYDPKLGSIVSRSEGGGSVTLSGQVREYVRVAQTDDWSEIEVPWAPAEVAAVRRLLQEHCEAQLGCRLEAWGIVAQIEELS